MRPFIALLAAALVVPAVPGAAAEDPAAAPPAASGPTTPELVEDLRILAILNVLQPTRDQSLKLAAAAQAGKQDLAEIEGEVRAKLAQQRDRLLAAREQALRGGAAPRETNQLLGIASQSAQSLRTQKTDSLIRTLADRVRRILTQEQAARIESDLAPTFDQPWRRYGQLLAGPTTAVRPPARMPADPGKWLKELRDLRIDSAEGDPMHEIEDFGKKLTRGLPSRSLC
jgi:hypothetical protein